MRTLVIDTATRACSVALFDDGNLVASRHELIGRGHAEKLLVFIADLPERGRSDKIAVNVGPGSFTGIRVGISAAKALALAWQSECFGFGCLDLVAAMAQEQSGAPTTVDVIMTGGHGEYFHQHFAGNGTPTNAAASRSFDDVIENCSAPVITGDVVASFADHIQATKTIELLPDAQYWPLIATHAPLAPSAIYGRAPDAKTMAEMQK